MRYTRIMELWRISKAHISRPPIRHSSFKYLLSSINLLIAATMLMRRVFLAVVLLVPYVQSAYVSHVGRQTDCEQFGTYPVYKGPCETTSKYSRL
jgi:hypothetical protein